MWQIKRIVEVYEIVLIILYIPIHAAKVIKVSISGKFLWCLFPYLAMFNLRESGGIGSGGFDIGSLDTYYEACEKFGGR